MTLKEASTDQLLIIIIIAIIRGNPVHIQDGLFISIQEVKEEKHIQSLMKEGVSSWLQ